MYNEKLFASISCTFTCTLQFTTYYYKNLTMICVPNIIWFFDILHYLYNSNKLNFIVADSGTICDVIGLVHCLIN